MKTSHLLLLGVTVILSSGHLHAQVKNDSLMIKETALHYIEGLFTNNVERMEKAIHPELAKRVIRKDKEGNYRLSNMGFSELIYYTKTIKIKDEKPGEPFQAEVIIFDISHEIASVKVTQNKFKFEDFIHLGKINGEWKIINLLWTQIE